MKHKLLSTMMTLCIALMLMTVSAMAEANVAQIGETGYATLQEAVNAAKSGETVTLLTDIAEDVTIDKNITLDLGGKTLTNTNAGVSTLTVTESAVVTAKNGSIVGGTGRYTIEVAKGSNANLTLTDITAKAGNTGSSMIDNWGTLTITSGTYTGGLNVVKNEEDATLKISGGVFTLEEAKGTFTAVVLNWGSLEITDGTFIQSATTGQSYYAPQVIHTDRDSNGTKEPSTIIACGVFKNLWNKSQCWTIRESTLAAGATKVFGGTFNKELQTSYIANGSYLTKNSDGTYGIAKGECEAMIGKVGYPTLEEALGAVTAGGTVKLVRNVTVEERLVIAKRMTLDLGGYTLTSTYAMGSATGENRYALVNNWALTIKNGTFAAGQARAIGAYYKLTLDSVTVQQELTGDEAVVAFCKDKQTYEIKKSTITGAYSVSIFADNATVTISDSKLNGTGNTLYHNGTNYGLKLTVKNTEITSSGSCGVYISGSTSAQSNTANQNGTGGYQQASFTNCTISGATNGVEVKYTNLTLDICTVSTTATEASYKQENNGPAGSGFAVVSTDNAMNSATPKPEGTIKITGDGTYTGPVGLGSLASVKTEFKDFTDDTIKVSGGTFSQAVPEDYCADGYIPTKNDDGTYGVEKYKPIEYWTGFTADTKTDKTFATLDEAMTHAAAKQSDATKRVVIAGEYTLTKDTSIPEGVYVDVMGKLTISAGVTLTVPANAKRLGAWAGGVIEGEGKVLIKGRGIDFSESKVMINGTMSTDMLIVPDGFILAKNANSYFAGKALYEITYGDKTVQSANLDDLKGATKVKLLDNVNDFAGTIKSDVADGFVLDLGGFTLTGKATATSPVLSISVPMTIQNGTIKCASSNAGSGALYTSADVTIASDAIIDGGAGYAIWTNGYDHTLTVNGTVKCEGDYAITGNGSENGSEIADCSITVNDGAVISAPNGIAIYHPELGTVTINGGEIKGRTGIEMCAGKLVVSGGSITSTGDNMDATGSQNAILDGAAISIINRNYPGGVPTAEIKGGTIQATGTGLTVKAYDYTDNTVKEWSTAGDSVNISGGTFSSIPTNMAALCASGYTATRNADGTYEVRRVSSSSGSSGSSTSAITTPSKTENGTVTVSPKNASKGDTVTITVKPDSGYVLGSLTVTDSKGNELKLTDKGDGKYTFTMPAGKVEVKASFAKEIETSPFADVATDAYYYEAVKWAVKNGITTGVGDNLFAPGQPCTRAQIVTFLWRAAGSPEPKGTASSMTDVVSGSYYEKAVAWAIENGVTTGTTTTTFSPDATCTRAQAVTFLARALNAKATSTAEFSDVPTDSYFAEAVAWAAANGVTEGVGNGLFAPDNDCTRAQIVTFLYRAYNN